MDNLSILARIKPSGLCYTGATTCLLSWAMEPNHLLHQWLTATPEPSRPLKLRHPFVSAAKELLQQSKDFDTGVAQLHLEHGVGEEHLQTP